MVSFEEIQVAYYMVAATGILVAAIYYIITLRSTMDNRKAQLLMEYNRIISSKEWLTDLHESLNYDWSDYEDFDRKYGHPNPEAHSRWISIANSMESALMLLDRNLVNADMLSFYLGSVSIGMFWEKFSPAINEMRVRMNSPNMFHNIESYCNKWMEQ